MCYELFICNWRRYLSGETEKGIDNIHFRCQFLKNDVRYVEEKYTLRTHNVHISKEICSLNDSYIYDTYKKKLMLPQPHIKILKNLVGKLEFLGRIKATISMPKEPSLLLFFRTSFFVRR